MRAAPVAVNGVTVRSALWVLLALVSACSSEGPKVVDAGVAPPKPKALARLTLAQGQVEIARDGKPARSAEIEDLYDQDLIITGEGARAVLKFKSGGELELAQNSRFRLTASAANVDVDLKTGIISLLEGEGATLITPYGRTRLGAGAGAKLAKEGDGLSLELMVGQIETLDEDGGTLTVKAGQKLKFQVGAVEVLDEAEQPTGELTLLPIALYSLAGTPEVKAKGEKKFKPVKDKLELTIGAAFKTGGNAKAKLEGAGMTAQIAPGALGTLERAGKRGKRREVEVTLNGVMDLQFAGDAPTELALPGGARIRGDVPARARVTATPNGTRIALATGEMEVFGADGTSQKIHSGEVATIEKGKVSVAAAKKPALMIPMTSKRVRATVGGGQEVGLDLPEELVETQVASDSEFKQLIISGKAKGYVAIADPPTHVYWRTLGADGKPDEKVGHAEFKRERSEGKSERTDDTVVETEFNANVVFQGEVVPALTFTWEPTPNAATYSLKIYPKGSTTPAFEGTTKELKLMVDSGKLKEGKYSWSAAPISATGADLSSTRKQGGKMAQLEISFDNSVTGLTILEPGPKAKANGSTHARGVAPIGSRLTINGNAVSLDEKGRFDHPVGKTSPLVFRCVGKDGSEDYVVRTTR
jgi:hypothetical protein